MDKTSGFENALYGIGKKIRRTLEFVPESVKRSAEEIRLRTGQPVSLTVKGRPVFVRESGAVSEYISSDMLRASKSDLEESFLLLCRNSVYAHEAEIKNGYIMMRNGHRAGICGTVSEEGAISNISSLNIRISHEIKGCANKLVSSYDGGGFLIAGPPGSGKTTLLRDFIRQLSSGRCGRYLRIAVIDSRGELSGGGGGEFANDLGENTDILMVKDKALGTETALRTLFPDVIAFDEIGTAAELEKVSQCFHAGVSVITTAHTGSKTDLLRRSVTASLIKTQAVSKIAILNPDIGKDPEIVNAEDLSCNSESDF